jgi:hypothetical protein
MTTRVIDVIDPRRVNPIMGRWSAEYRVIGDGDARIVQINALSSITVVVSKVLVDWYAAIGLPPYYSYYIAVPNFNAATEGYETMELAEGLADDLAERGMPWVDALTVAEVLSHAAELFAK